MPNILILEYGVPTAVGPLTEKQPTFLYEDGSCDDAIISLSRSVGGVISVQDIISAIDALGFQEFIAENEANIDRLCMAIHDYQMEMIDRQQDVIFDPPPPAWPLVPPRVHRQQMRHYADRERIRPPKVVQRIWHQR